MKATHKYALERMGAVLVHMVSLGPSFDRTISTGTLKAFVETVRASSKISLMLLNVSIKKGTLFIIKALVSV